MRRTIYGRSSRVMCLLMTAIMMAGLLCLSVGGGASSSKITVGFVVKTMANPFYTRMLQGAQQAAKELGIELLWVAAEQHTDVAGQLRIVEDMIERKVDALVLNPAGPEAIVPAIDRANKLGIPVSIVDTKAAGGKIVTFVGVDNVTAGKLMGEFIIKTLNGKGKVAIIEGVRGQSTAEERLSGYRAALEKAPGIKIVASQAGDWDRAKGMMVAENILQAHPDLDLIIGSNDEMALGALRAVEASGRANRIKVVGFDAIKDALESIKAGKLLATIDQYPDKQGYEGVRAVVDALKGKKVDPSIMIGVALITKDNVGEFLK